MNLLKRLLYDADVREEGHCAPVSFLHFTDERNDAESLCIKYALEPCFITLSAEAA
jgi:hypothetical protein